VRVIDGVKANEGKRLAELTKEEAKAFARKQGNTPLPWHITPELRLSTSSWTSMQRADTEYSPTTLIYVYADDYERVMGTSAVEVFGTQPHRGCVVGLVSGATFKRIWKEGMRWQSAAGPGLPPDLSKDLNTHVPVFDSGYYWVPTAELYIAGVTVAGPITDNVTPSPILISPQQAATIFNDGLGKLFSEYNSRVKTWVNSKQEEIDQLKGQPNQIEKAVKTVVAAMDMVRFVIVVARRGHAILQDSVELDLYDVPQKNSKNFSVRRD
jgi:hypothetical protein